MKEKDQDSSYDGFDVNKVFIPFSAMVSGIFPTSRPILTDSLDRLLVVPDSYEQHEACKDETRHILGRLHNFDPERQRGCRHLGHARRGQSVLAP